VRERERVTRGTYTLQKRTHRQNPFSKKPRRRERDSNVAALEERESGKVPGKVFISRRARRRRKRREQRCLFFEKSDENDDDLCGA